LVIKFVDEITHALSENLNTDVIQKDELDDEWSYVGIKKILNSHGFST
jgi:hypothetical protein